MKKLTTLALAAGLIVAAAAPASAVDTKVDGQYVFTFQRAQTGFEGADEEYAAQRFRLGLTFTASENLSGYVQFQTKEGWGEKDATEADVVARQAYIDWMIPGTTAKVRMGKFGLGLPADTFGHNQCFHFGTIRAGVQVTMPVADWLDASVMWSRQAGAELAGVDAENNTDIFGAYANMKFDGLTVSPWMAYSHGQKGTYGEPRGKDVIHDAKTDANAYFAGVTAALTMFDPFSLKATVAGGVRDYDQACDRSGWYAQALASYKLSFGTPQLGIWYGSGDDKDAKYAHQNWVPTAKGKFAPSTTYYANESYLADGQAYGNIAGTWGIKLGLNGVSFLEGLTHDFAVVMINGTNHNEAKKLGTDYGNYLTWSDTVYEFDFNTTYSIYKNLGAKLELAYVLNDLNLAADAKNDKDDWRAALSFEYKF